jgi:hypothetical protein
MGERPILKRTVRLREEEFGGLVYDRETSDIFEVNHIGYEILKLCTGELTVDEIALRIALKYGEDVEKVKSDVKSFLDSARERGLLMVV